MGFGRLHMDTSVNELFNDRWYHSIWFKTSEEQSLAILWSHIRRPVAHIFMRARH